MASNKETAKTTVDIDGTNAKAELDRLTDHAIKLREQLRALRLDPKATQEDILKLSKQFDEAKEKVGIFKRSIFDLNATLKDLNGSSLKDLTRAQSELQTQINKSAKATDEDRKALNEKVVALKKVKNEISDVTQKMYDTRGPMSKFSDTVNKYWSVIAAGVAIVIGAFSEVGEYLTEWDKAAQSEKKLQEALKGREEILPSLMKNAAELQDTMNVPHEVIESQEAFLAAQGRTEDQIKKTMRAAIQMAAVVPGMDLTSAVKQLDSSYAGVLRGLNRLDPAFKTLTKEQLENGAAVDLVNEKYQGFAETAAKEGLGPLKQMGLIWTDVKENLGGLFASVLMPMATGFKNIASGLREATTEGGSIVRFLKAFWAIIVPVISGLVTYLSISKAIVVIEELKNLKIKQGLILSNLQAVWLRLKIALTGEATFAELRAIATTKAMNAALITNPWTAAFAAIVAVGVALYQYSNRITTAIENERMLKDVMTDAKKNILEQKNAVESLLRVAKDHTKSEQDRLNAVKELQRISPEYLGGLKLEKINTDEARAAVDQYIESIEKMARVEAAKKKLVELQGALIDLQTAGKGSETSWDQDIVNGIKSLGNAGVFAVNTIKTVVTNGIEQTEKLKAQMKMMDDIIVGGDKKTSGNPNNITVAQQIKEENRIIADAIKEKTRLMKVGSDDLIKDLEAQDKEISDAKARLKTLTGVESGTPTDAADKARAARIKKIDQDRQKDLITKEQYDEETIKSDILYYDAKLKLASLKEGEKTDLLKKSSEANEKLRKFYYDRDLKSLEKSDNDEKYELTKQHYVGKINDATFKAMMLQSDLDFLTKKLELQKKAGLDTTDIQKEIGKKTLDAQIEMNDLIKKAQDELSKAGIDNLQNEVDKQIAIQQDAWDKEFELLKNRLIVKEKLSEEEMRMNGVTNDIIAEKTKAFNDRIAALKNAGLLQLFDVDEFYARSDDDKWAIRHKKAQAEYDFEFKQAGKDSVRKMNAAKKLEKDYVDIEKERAEKTKAIRLREIDNAEMIVNSIAAFVDSNSALGKALLVFQKGLAIAKIWIETAAANAVISATASVQTIMGNVAAPGIAAALIAKNNISAGINTALIAAQTIATVSGKKGFRSGGYTGSGIGVQDSDGYEIAGVVHPGEYVVPAWMRTMPVVANFERVMEGIRINKGYTAGGVVSPMGGVASAGSVSGSGSDEELKAILIANARAIENLEKRFSVPIQAQTVLLGKNGFIEAQAKLSKIQKSANF